MSSIAPHTEQGSYRVVVGTGGGVQTVTREGARLVVNAVGGSGTVYGALCETSFHAESLPGFVVFNVTLPTAAAADAPCSGTALTPARTCSVSESR